VRNTPRIASNGFHGVSIHSRLFYQRLVATRTTMAMLTGAQGT
jgi:hypothetical protein